MKNWAFTFSFLAQCFLFSSSFAQPSLVWSKVFPGDMSGDFFFFESEISLDTADNIYFYADTAWTAGSFISKTDKDGNGIWQINLMPGVDTFSIHTVTDVEGNTYGVRGSMNGSSLFKLSSSGSLVWNSSFLPAVYLYYLGLDGYGNLYALQSSQFSPGNLYKFDTSGNSIWISSLPFTNMWRACTDHEGNLIIDANDGDTSSLIKINPAGDIIWTQGIGTPHSLATQIITDGQGSIIVAGIKYMSANTDHYLAKCDSSGALLWSLVTDSSDYDEPLYITTDQLGNVYSTMYFTANNGQVGRFLIRKFNSAGNLQWFYVPEDSIDFAHAGFWFPHGPVRIDSSGNVYAGTTVFDSIFRSFAIYKLSSSGNLLWAVKEKEPGLVMDYLCDLQLGRDGSIYAVGSSETGLTGIWLIKLSEENSGIDSVEMKTSLKIFPNPASSSLNFHCDEGEILAYSIYNMEGKLLFQNQEMKSKDVSIDIRDIETGIYLLQIQTTSGFYNEKVEIVN